VAQRASGAGREGVHRDNGAVRHRGGGVRELVAAASIDRDALPLRRAAQLV